MGWSLKAFEISILLWVGLDSATNLEYVKRPIDSAERGIGAHSSRIQRALGGLHSTTRPIGVDLDS